MVISAIGIGSVSMCLKVEVQCVLIRNSSLH